MSNPPPNPHSSHPLYDSSSGRLYTSEKVQKDFSTPPSHLRYKPLDTSDPLGMLNTPTQDPVINQGGMKPDSPGFKPIFPYEDLSFRPPFRNPAPTSGVLKASSNPRDKPWSLGVNDASEGSSQQGNATEGQDTSPIGSNQGHKMKDWLPRSQLPNYYRLQLQRAQFQV